MPLSDNERAVRTFLKTRSTTLEQVRTRRDFFRFGLDPAHGRITPRLYESFLNHSRREAELGTRGGLVTILSLYLVVNATALAVISNAKANEHGETFLTLDHKEEKLHTTVTVLVSFMPFMPGLYLAANLFFRSEVDSHTPLSTLLNQTHSKYHHQPEPTLPELLATYLAQQGFPTAKDAKAFAEIYFSNSSETTFLNRIPANLSQATVSKCARWVAKRAPKIIKGLKDEASTYRTSLQDTAEFRRPQNETVLADLQPHFEFIQKHNWNTGGKGQKQIPALCLGRDTLPIPAFALAVVGGFAVEIDVLLAFVVVGFVATLGIFLRLYCIRKNPLPKKTPVRVPAPGRL